jgi:PAS domain S-box-containing protein
MAWQNSPYVVPLLMAAFMTAILARLAWGRRPAPGAAPLAILNLAICEWSVGYALGMASADLGAKVFWAKIQYVGIVAVPVAWLILALQHTGRERWPLRRYGLWLSIMPILTLLLVWTNESHGLIWSDVRLGTAGSSTVLVLSYGVFFWAWIAFTYTLVFLGSGLLLHNLILSARPYRQQSLALLVAALAPLVGNVLRITRLNPLPQLDLTNLGFILSGPALFWALFRYRLLDIVPVARDALIESLDDAVIVLDEHRRVVDLNPAAARLVGHPASVVIGQQASQILEGKLHLPEDIPSSGKTATEVTLAEGGREHHLELRISPLQEQRARFQGWLVTLHDITARKRAERALTAAKEQWERTFDAVPDLIMLVDGEHRIMRTNRAMAERLGLSPSEAVGRVCYEAVHGCRQPPASCPHVRLLLDGEEHTSEIHEERIGGDFLVSVSPLYDGKGQVVASVHVARDITESRQVEAERRQREDFLALLNEITRAALRTPNLTAMAQILADRLGELLGADGCYITLWDEGAQLPRPLAAYGAARHNYRVIEVKPGEPTVTEAVLRAGRPLVIEDVHHTPYLSQRIADLFPDHSMLGLPLLAGGQMRGAALLAFNQPHQFTPEEIARGEQIAEHIALAMTRAWLLENERSARQRTEALFHVARSLIAYEDLPTRLQTVVDSVAEALPADRVTLVVVDLGAQEVLHFVKGGPGAGQVISVPFDELQEGLTGWVMREGMPALSPAERPDPRENPAVQRRRAETNCGDIIVAPLAYRDEVLGTLTAIRRPDEPSFAQPDVNLLTAIASQAAIGIENVRLVLGLEATVAARTAEIYAEQEKSEAILRSVGDAISVTDLQMRIQYVNDAFTTLTGYTAEEVLGRHASFLSASPSPDRMHGFAQTVQEEHQVWQSEVTVQRKDGRRYDALLTIAPMRDAEGALVGYVSSHRDISQQKELDRARDRFLINISHELRTPLSNISLYAQLLQRVQDSPEKRERYLRVLNEQIARLKVLVQGTVQMTELDTGHAVDAWEPIQLASLVRDTMVAFQSQATAAGLTLRAHTLPLDLPPVMGDHRRLAQALAELVENAITFTPSGGRVTVAARPAERDGQTWVTIAVEDTGLGIPPQEQDLIFHRFYRGGSAEAGDIPGAGLGLSIAQQIVQAHGGRVSVQSSGVPGQGSTFTLWLPTVP